jgi:adenylate kinase family enzyme
MGRAGSGKSTVAACLGEALGIPVVHLDSLFWDATWQPVGWTIFGRLEESEAAADEWIIDGNYVTSPGFGTRIGRAQLVVVVEARLFVCLWRVICRSLFLAKASRRDLPTGARDRLSLGFLKWVLRWGSRHPDFAHELSLQTAAPVVVLRSAGDVDRLVRRLASNTAASASPAIL